MHRGELIAHTNRERKNRERKQAARQGVSGVERIIVTGGRRLEGRVRVEGAKNAILPIIAASLLAEGESVLEEVPPLDDVHTICEVLRRLGVAVDFTGDGRVRVRVPRWLEHEAPYELVRKMRASFLVMGPLLARTGRARISLPGGCAIGTRPIDLHLKGFEALGASVTLGYGYIEVQGDRLRGSRIYLDFPSVGATENIMMAACLAEGITTIENAAEEPEVVDLANYLNAMGSCIRGAGTNLIRIEGVEGLRGTTYRVIPDRIEAGTYMVAAAITGGEILVENALHEHLKPVIAKLKEAGAEILEDDGCLRIVAPSRPRAVDVKTLPYPGFPTDMQAQMMALLSIADGTSIVTETVFENRFMHVHELKRMGADIRIEGRSAIIRGVNRLTGAPVRATDLRAGAALVLAGLAAEGRTEISGVHHLDRGYLRLEEKLRRLGASVERTRG